MFLSVSSYSLSSFFLVLCTCWRRYQKAYCIINTPHFKCTNNDHLSTITKRKTFCLLLIYFLSLLLLHELLAVLFSIVLWDTVWKKKRKTLSTQLMHFLVYWGHLHSEKEHTIQRVEQWLTKSSKSTNNPRHDYYN